MVMQIKIGFRKRLEVVIYLQRIVRGFLARNYIIKKKLLDVLRKTSTRVIIRAYRRYRFLKSRVNWDAVSSNVIFVIIIIYCILYRNMEFKFR